ncbi:MAG: replication-associated recombination protein A [bacterium]|nr:MAG: replication-associated recombination protein A [bacterium]
MTGDLFPPRKEERGEGATRPLADRMRPEALDDFVGQEELVGQGAILRRMIEEDRLRSVIFWGPPGSGKTTLARLIAHRTGAHFLSYSAVTSGSKEMKSVMATARDIRLSTGKRTIMFVDEVHRFNRAQQDAFLPYVEAGDVILIGATTENPSFEVNAALLSRSKVFVFGPLSDDQIVTLVRRALERDPELSAGSFSLTEDALDTICRNADGDARRALNALEMAVLLAAEGGMGEGTITGEMVTRAIQGKSLAYDKTGEEHYNIISALHKSIRNSDPDASLYWLARMLEGGEDRRYLLRRLARVAVEDVGLADPGAIVQASAASQTFDFVGEPEGDLILAQLVIYLAMAPKSNSVYTAYGRAVSDVRKSTAHPVPLHIRNAPTSLMKGLGYGRGYEYAHDMPHRLSKHSFFPEEMGERRYYLPGDQGKEKNIKERLMEIRKVIRRLREGGGEEEIGGGEEEGK